MVLYWGIVTEEIAERESDMMRTGECVLWWELIRDCRDSKMATSSAEWIEVFGKSLNTLVVWWGSIM